MPAHEPVLQAVGVGKAYRSGGQPLQVLDGLDFALHAGELVAIVGASGVGKSTLLHVLGGIDRADSGRVLHRGQDLVAMTPSLRARFRNREVGFVFQFHHLLPEFTALENVMMPRLIAGERKATAATRARALLEEMGLGERVDHRPGALSGGEQQRVAIARALAMDAGIVLADEPTGNLDAATGEQVFEAFSERVRARGASAVLVTHNEFLAGRADRVLRLRGGRLETAV